MPISIGSESWASRGDRGKRGRYEEGGDMKKGDMKEVEIRRRRGEKTEKRGRRRERGGREKERKGAFLDFELLIFF